jgi:hypothetical protein
MYLLVGALPSSYGNVKELVKFFFPETQLLHNSTTPTPTATPPLLRTETSLGVACENKTKKE